eukprot:6187458-Pleurochrysis_carterae.AAC.1
MTRLSLQRRAHQLEERCDVLELAELLAQVLGDGARRALGALLVPVGDEIVKHPRALTERDPVLAAELAQLLHVLLEDGARADVGLDVGAHVVEAAHLRRWQREVLAVVDELGRGGGHLLQLGLPLLDTRDHRLHLVCVLRLELLRLELEPARRELLDHQTHLVDASVDLATEVIHLVLHPLVENVKRRVELLPPARDCGEVEPRARHAAHQLVGLLELLDRLAHLRLRGADARPLAPRVADFVNRLWPARERLKRGGDKLLDLLLLGARVAPDREQHRVRQARELILELDALEARQRLDLLAARFEQLHVHLERLDVRYHRVDQVVQIALVRADERVGHVLVHHLLKPHEQVARSVVDCLKRRHVAVGHVTEYFEHLVLARAALVVVSQPLEPGRDRDELFDLAVEICAQFLESGAQSKTALLELELA